MTYDPNNPAPDDLLSAFADGELDGEQLREAQAQVDRDPAAAGRVADQQKLRQAVSKAMDGPQYGCPDELRNRLAELAKTVAAESDAPKASAPARSNSPVLARIGKWAPAAIAAVLMIAAIAVISQSMDGPSTPANNNSNGLVFNASQAERFGNRHALCSRDSEYLSGVDAFPQNLTELPGALGEYFKTPVDPEAMDLSAVGYEFQVAGLCVLPGSGSVHVIYQSQTPNPGDEPWALSLWMRPYTAQTAPDQTPVPELKPDKLYASEATEHDHPMIVWRQGGMAYYLVGDDYDTVQRAFAAISTGRN